MSLEKIVNQLTDYAIRPLASAGKVLLRSGRPSTPGEKKENPLIIMGNGPSLRSFIDSDPQIREGFDLMAVNFAANSPEYRSLRPQLYILADPHFFAGVTQDENVGRLWHNLTATTWPMTLWLPVSVRRLAWALTSALPKNIEVKWFNLTPVEGRGPLSRLLLQSGMGMPRPRNVLIPAIMTALRDGYRKIFLVGADHSWSRSLWVDDANRVVSIQPHFYKDNKKEAERVASEYAGYHLHDILESLTTAFRSYFAIAEYASSKDAKIWNATPGSFIDAFPRCGYAQMPTLSKT